MVALSVAGTLLRLWRSASLLRGVLYVDHQFRLSFFLPSYWFSICCPPNKFFPTIEPGAVEVAAMCCSPDLGNISSAWGSRVGHSEAHVIKGRPGPSAVKAPWRTFREKSAVSPPPPYLPINRSYRIPLRKVVSVTTNIITAIMLDVILIHNNNDNNILRFTRCARLNKIIMMLHTELYTLTLSKVN